MHPQDTYPTPTPNNVEFFVCLFIFLSKTCFVPVQRWNRGRGRFPIWNQWNYSNLHSFQPLVLATFVAHCSRCLQYYRSIADYCFLCCFLTKQWVGERQTVVWTPRWFSHYSLTHHSCLSCLFISLFFLLLLLEVWLPLDLASVSDRRTDLHPMQKI